MATAVEPNEIVTEIRLPPWTGRRAWAIDEVSRRKGDFAMVGVALWMELNPDSTCKHSRITLFGVGGKPVRAKKAEGDVHPPLLEVADELEPDSDIHASAQYRKEVGGVLARRALAQASARLAEGTA